MIGSLVPLFDKEYPKLKEGSIVLLRPEAAVFARRVRELGDYLFNRLREQIRGADQR